MSIDLNGFWQSWDVVSGNIAASNEYEFWKGMVMSNGQVLNNQFDFFKYHNTTRYEWFKALQGTYPQVWDEYTFYKNTNDARIFDFYTFYEYCGEYLVGTPSPTPTPVPPTPTPIPPTPTPTPTPTPVNMSGGTVTTEVISGVTYRVHTFTSSGELTVIQGGLVQLLMVAGGGAGGNGVGIGFAGGGGGGQIYTAVTITSGGTITIGNGGISTYGDSPTNGSNTTGLGFTAIGGGANQSNGGNGGGANCNSTTIGLGTLGQGNDGTLPYRREGPFGDLFAGDGGSSNNQAGYSIGGLGASCDRNSTGSNGAANTGNGGGGSRGSGRNGGSGGSGVVVIKYPI